MFPNRSLTLASKYTARTDILEANEVGNTCNICPTGYDENSDNVLILPKAFDQQIQTKQPVVLNFLSESESSLRLTMHCPMTIRTGISPGSSGI